MLATQNPVDLDYKAMSNAGTWLVGRLQTENDKARVLEGAAIRGRRDGHRGALDAGSAGWPSVSSCSSARASNQPVVFSTRDTLSRG